MDTRRYNNNKHRHLSRPGPPRVSTTAAVAAAAAAAATATATAAAAAATATATAAAAAAAGATTAAAATATAAAATAAAAAAATTTTTTTSEQRPDVFYPSRLGMVDKMCKPQLTRATMATVVSKMFVLVAIKLSQKTLGLVDLAQLLAVVLDPIFTQLAVEFLMIAMSREPMLTWTTTYVPTHINLAMARVTTRAAELMVRYRMNADVALAEHHPLVDVSLAGYQMVLAYSRHVWTVSNGSIYGPTASHVADFVNWLGATNDYTRKAIQSIQTTIRTIPLQGAADVSSFNQSLVRLVQLAQTVAYRRAAVQELTRRLTRAWINGPMYTVIDHHLTILTHRIRIMRWVDGVIATLNTLAANVPTAGVIARALVAALDHDGACPTIASTPSMVAGEAAVATAAEAVAIAATAEAAAAAAAIAAKAEAAAAAAALAAPAEAAAAAPERLPIVPDAWLNELADALTHRCVQLERKLQAVSRACTDTNAELFLSLLEPYDGNVRGLLLHLQQENNASHPRR